MPAEGTYAVIFFIYLLLFGLVYEIVTGTLDWRKNLNYPKYDAGLAEATGSAPAARTDYIKISNANNLSNE